MNKNILNIKEELKKDYNIDFNNFKKIINDQVLLSTFCRNIEKKEHHKKKFLEINKKLFLELIDLLNSYFNIKMDEKFWRILIGPWFYVATEIFYNRYNSIKELINNKRYDKLIFEDLDEEPFISKSHLEFLNLATGNLDWNQSILFEIIKRENISYEIKSVKNKEYKHEEKKGFLYLLKKKINTFLFLINSKSQHLIINTSLPRLKEFFLQLKYMRFVLFYLPDFFQNIKLKYSYNKILRNELYEKYLKVSHKHSEEEKIIKYFILKHMPIIYLENFIFLSNKIKNFQYKSVLTSQHFDYNEFYKFLAAHLSLKKLKIFYLQHGNVDGVSKFDTYSNHFKSAHKYLSWGWDDKKDKSTIFKFYNLKNSGYKKFDKNFKFNKSLIFFSTAIEKNLFFYDVQERNKKKYFEQIVFIENLSSEIKSLTKVKLHQSELGHPNILAKAIKEKIPKLEIIKKNKKISKYNNLLSVYSYDSTGFLEHVCLNKPCLMYLDDYQNEVNAFSLPFYNELKRVNVIHNSAEDASKFINTNWSNILNWWYSDEVQSVIFEFSNNFSKYTKEPLKEIKIFLEKEIKK